MTDRSWRQVSDELGRILELPESDRPTALLQLGEADALLASEVVGLLAYETDRSGADEVPLTLDRINEYHLIEEIGRGGTSVVYAATKDGLDRVVALKLILTRAETTARSSAYRREQGALALLRHPSIVSLLDGGLTDGGLPYLVLERVRGVRIDEYCRTSCNSAEEVVGVFLKLAEAVGAAHAIGIVHRDIKPSNVLVEESGLPRLLDFGVAKVPTQENTTTLAAMTLAFASPEQIKGVPTTRASDVYSLGVLLFELLTQRSPYRMEPSNLLGFFEAVCEEEVEEPARYAFSGAAANANAALNRILNRCLQKDPEERYQTANQLADDVRRWRRDGSSAASSMNWRIRLFRVGLRRHLPFSLPLVIGAGVLLAVAAVWLIKNDAANKTQIAIIDENHRRTTERLIKAVLVEIDAANDVPGSLAPTRRALLIETMASLRSLEQSGGGEGMLYEFGVVHEQMSRKTGSEYEGIRETLEAQRYYFRLHGAAPEKALYKVALARNYLRMAELYEAAKDYSGMNSALREARRYAKTLAGDATSAALVELIERREAAGTLWTTRQYMKYDHQRDEFTMIADFGWVAETERRNGLWADAERSYRTGRRALAAASARAFDELKLAERKGDLGQRIAKLRELSFQLSMKNMQRR